MARELGSATNSIFQSEFYIDSDSGEQREIDVVGWFSRFAPTPEDLCRVAVAVECKLAREKPWVIFTRQHPVSSIAFVAQRAAASPDGNDFLSGIAGEMWGRDLPLLGNPDRAGYGLTQAFTTGNDVPYTAAISAAKAAASEVKQFRSRKHLRCVIALPVIVIDGTLVECFLDEGPGEVSVRTVDRAVLVWRRRLTGQPHTIIDVVTLAAFKSYVDDLRVTAERLLQAMEERAPKLLALRPRNEPATPMSAPEAGQSDAG